MTHNHPSSTTSTISPALPLSDSDSEIDFYSANDDEVVIMNTPDKIPIVIDDNEVADSRPNANVVSNVNIIGNSATVQQLQQQFAMNSLGRSNLNSSLAGVENYSDNNLFRPPSVTKKHNQADVASSDEVIDAVTFTPGSYNADFISDEIVEADTQLKRSTTRKQTSTTGTRARQVYDSESEESYESSFVTSDEDIPFFRDAREDWTPGSETTSISNDDAYENSSSSDESVTEVMSPRSQVKAELIDLTMEGPWSIPRVKDASLHRRRRRRYVIYDGSNTSDSDSDTKSPSLPTRITARRRPSPGQNSDEELQDDESTERILMPPQATARRRLSYGGNTDEQLLNCENTKFASTPLECGAVEEAAGEQELCDENMVAASEKQLRRQPSIADNDCDYDLKISKDYTPMGQSQRVSTISIDDDKLDNKRNASLRREPFSLVRIDGDNISTENDTPPSTSKSTSFKHFRQRREGSDKRNFMNDSNGTDIDSTASNDGAVDNNDMITTEKNDVELTNEELEAIEKLAGAFSSLDMTFNTIPLSPKETPGNRMKKSKPLKIDADVIDLTDGISDVKATPEKGGIPKWLSSLSPKRLSGGKVAERLLNYLDTSVLQSALGDLVTVEWNKRLLTTAGTCTLCRRGAHTRLARIELSTKVLDESNRLYQTLAHEMCHAAAWVVDGVAKPPHGAVFKKWAKRFHEWDKDLSINTCHSYDIRTKYSYVCEKCGHRWGRHSKSINTGKVRCSCGGSIKLDKK